MLIGLQRRVGLRLHPRGLIETALNAVAPFFDDLANAGQRSGHQEVERAELTARLPQEPLLNVLGSNSGKTSGAAAVGMNSPV